MIKKQKKSYQAILIVTAPFVIADTVVCAEINQKLWDCVPANFQDIIFWATVIIVYLVGFRAAIGLFYRNFIGMTKGISNNMRQSVYEHAMNQRFWLKDGGAVSGVLNNDITLLEKEYYYAWILLLIKAGEIISACVVAFYENVFYGLFCFLVMGIPVFCVKKSADKVGQASQEILKIQKEYMEFIARLQNGKETICCYALFQPVFKLHGNLANQLTQMSIYKKDEMVKNKILNQNMNRYANTVVSLAGFYLVGKGEISLGWVMAFTQLASSMTYTLMEALQECIRIYGSRPIKQEIFQKYELESPYTFEETEKNKSDILEKEAGISENCEQHKKNFKITCNIQDYRIKGHPVLQDIVFELNPGDKLLINGSNGSGKTTLLKILLGFIQPDEYEGKVQWIDTENDQMVFPEKNVAYMPQTPFVFYDTVKNNITQGRSKDEEKYEKIKEMVGLTVDDERMLCYSKDNISSGEKQKIGIARAMYSEENIFVMDEPYSTLDQKSLLQIEKHILDNPEQTVITISHFKNENSNLYNKVLTLENGKIYKMYGF